MTVARGTMLLMLCLLAACEMDATEPRDLGPQTGPRVAAVVEITFHNIGRANMTSSALVAPNMAELNRMRAARVRAAASGETWTQDLKVPDGGNATIQLDFIATHLDVEQRLGPDFVYMRADYFVRNAQNNGTPFSTPRTNLTFLAVGTANTISNTAVSRFLRADGSPADPLLALLYKPTGAVHSDRGAVKSLFPDVLQVFLESEVALPLIQAQDPTVTNTFPYGFVVRTLSDTDRTLAPNPPPTFFQGFVNFAFRIPILGGGNDPETISVIMLALDDTETKLTQSLEEQMKQQSQKEAERTASDLKARIIVMPIDILFGGPFIAEDQGDGLRRICTVRTAGFRGAGTAFLVNDRSGPQPCDDLP